MKAFAAIFFAVIKWAHLLGSYNMPNVHKVYFGGVIQHDGLCLACYTCQSEKLGFAHKLMRNVYLVKTLTCYICHFFINILRIF